MAYISEFYKEMIAENNSCLSSSERKRRQLILPEARMAGWQVKKLKVAWVHHSEWLDLTDLPAAKLWFAPNQNIGLVIGNRMYFSYTICDVVSSLRGAGLSNIRDGLAFWSVFVPGIFGWTWLADNK